MKGFKDFLMRGNLIELAVAFILGGAFSTVVKSFTTILMDLIGKLGGTPNFSDWVPGGVHVGAFITAVISFFVMSLVIYFGLIKPIELATEKLKRTNDEPVAAPTTLTYSSRSATNYALVRSSEGAPELPGSVQHVMRWTFGQQTSLVWPNDHRAPVHPGTQPIESSDLTHLR